MMNQFAKALITLTILVPLVSNAADKKTEFGARITATNSITIEQAISALAKKKSSDATEKVLLTATVSKVCKKKGCWMTLKNDKGDLRVTFKDYDFFVPFKLVGQKVLVEGELKQKKMTLKETKHFAKDAGEDDSKITTAKTEYRIIASGVKLLN